MKFNEKYLSKDCRPQFIKIKPTVYAEYEKETSTVRSPVVTSNKYQYVVTLILEYTFLYYFILVLQLALGAGSYSGEGSPPMYGDYEAQRHWMEITVNLPIEQWYVNGTLNDLQYWGLDYPPLTAYHHYILGKIAYEEDRRWVSLFSSRGFESLDHKIFMRVSAMVPFFICYLPPLLLNAHLKNQEGNFLIVFAAAVYPGLLVIDNSHFQYNSISLGFFLSSYYFLVTGRMIFGSMFFVFALNYKQMELYHSLPIFVFILSRSLKKPFWSKITDSVFQLSKVAITVIATFGIIWSPFLLTGTWKDVLIRIFPFNRGIYEDKVASFWCAFFFILKRLPIQKWLIHMSTACVLLFAMPSLITLFLKPSNKNFRMSLFATSLSFFLFSFHVHEKTILLVSTCAILLMFDYPSDAIWFLLISNISLFSLCIKDGNPMNLLLFIAYFMYAILIWEKYDREKTSIAPTWLKTCSVIIGFGICLLELFGSTPARLPHLYQLANSFYCCIHFIFFLVLFSIRMISGGQNEKIKSE